MTRPVFAAVGFDRFISILQFVDPFKLAPGPTTVSGSSYVARGPTWSERWYNRSRMNLRFYLDPETGEPHIYNHGISEDEVEYIILQPGEDRIGREGTRLAIGQSQSGRYLRVIYVPDPEPNSVFVITAYELTGNPLLAYRRRQRREG